MIQATRFGVTLSQMKPGARLIDSYGIPVKIISFEDRSPDYFRVNYKYTGEPRSFTGSLDTVLRNFHKPLKVVTRSEH